MKPSKYPEYLEYYYSSITEGKAFCVELGNKNTAESAQHWAEGGYRKDKALVQL